MIGLVLIIIAAAIFIIWRVYTSEGSSSRKKIGNLYDEGESK